MRIQHNILAANAYRSYKKNVSELKKDVEKLASGLRINRSADDAAGLAISEKMRAQITGLETAQKNAKDGISLVQTAEGALTEVHDMLNRMIELATESANGTYESLDRDQLQKEIDQLRAEIDRIADGSNFNGIFLLDGSLDGDAAIPYEMDFEVGGTLPKVGSRQGIDTVLSAGATGRTKTSFEVDLDNLTFDPSAGKTLSISIKGVNIVLEAKAGTSPTILTAADIVSELLGESSGFSIIVQNTGYKANGLAELVIDGQNFKLTGDGSKLCFEQENVPASANQVAVPPTEITIKGVEGGTRPVSVSSTEVVSGSDGTKTTFTITVQGDATATDGSTILTFDGGDINVQSDSKWTEETEKGNWVAFCENLGNNKFKITLESRTPALLPSSPILGTSFSASVDDLKVSMGTASVKAKYTLDLSGWTGGDLTVETSDGEKTIAWDADPDTIIANAAADFDDYDLEYTDGTLTFRAKVAGEVGSTENQGAPGFSIEGASYKVTSDTASVAVGGAVTGSAGGSATPASTLFDLDQKMLTEGSTLTIGGTTYTFTSQPSGPNDVDTSDRDLETVARKLAQAAAGNGTYRVHSDGERVFLTEVQGQRGCDLSTVAGIESSLSFTGMPGTGKGLVLQIGDSSEEYDRLTVSIPDMHCESLDIDRIDVTTQENALDAISRVRAAINAVSGVRGGLGAIQNRLDHTINSLSVATENIQDAESTIRDTDVAEVLMTYTKNNILVQSAQTMLAQANQVPEGVLQLLQ